MQHRTCDIVGGNYLLEAKELRLDLVQNARLGCGRVDSVGVSPGDAEELQRRR